MMTTLRGPYPVANAGLGWAPPAHRHNYDARLGQTCPPGGAPPLDPTLNCQRDARGNAVCSNGLIFPPGCPHTPPDEYFTAGTTPDEIRDGAIQGKIPPPRGGGGGGTPGAPAASGGIPIIPIVAIGGAALAAFFFLR